MSKKKLKLDNLIDAEEVRVRLTAFTVASSNDGSSPQIRSQVLDLLKSVCAESRKKAEDILYQDGDGTACARRISHIQDELVRIIYDFAAVHVYPNPNLSDAQQMAITAVGGYGRGTLAPGSDIDLLFVLPYKQTSWCEQVIEYVLYMLWDMGFKVGQATRNLDECIRLSKQDMTIRTSILEVRFLHGNQKLYKTLQTRFSEEVVAGTASEFIAAKLAERDERHQKTGESRYLVEPNIKDGKGGLRDLHTLFWIGKYFYNIGRSRELVKAGMFTNREYRRFRKAEKFLWTVRCHLHFMTGKAEERLLFDFQREMAERLNYVGHGGLSAVERFMKHYFIVAKEVGHLTMIACAKLEEKEAKTVRGFNQFIRSVIRRPRRISGTKAFVNDNGRINVVDETAFRRDPLNIIRIFKVSDKTGLDFHPEAIERLSSSLSMVDKEFRKNAEANRIFLELVSSRRDPERILRRMNETGFLGRFIPPFRRIVAMMQFNMYHHYTVDEHLMRTVGALAGIESGKLADEHPLSTEILPEIKDRQALYLALLLHDVAKGRKEDHSIAGERVARQLCPRLGLDKQRTDLVAWLIREHLTMSMIAQGRDLSDRKTIRDFADKVQSVKRMRYLLILTVCDIRAVGPGVWNGWKGQLLRNLYHETELMISGGFSRLPQDSRVEQIKQELAEHLENWDPEDKRQIIDLPYSAYFLSTDIETQVRHMGLLRRIRDDGLEIATAINTNRFQEITEITVVAPDHPRLLSIIAGACAAADANIVDAKIHTTSDGRALDSIYINREFANDDAELRRAERVGAMIEDVLRGKQRLPEVIAQNTKSRRRQKAFKISPRVRINNNLSDTFSVIEVECLDRPGLLSDLASALADLKLDIGSAHAITFGEKVTDSFYVRDLVGHKIEDEERIKRIVDELMKIWQKPDKKTAPKTRNPRTETA